MTLKLGNYFTLIVKTGADVEKVNFSATLTVEIIVINPTKQ